MKDRKRFIFILVMAIIILLGLFAIGVYDLLDKMFPVADPVNVPELENITTISIIRDNGSSVLVETKDYEVFLQNISNTEPTRHMSVNEYPRVENYYLIKIDTSEREYHYFIYVEDAQVYMESLYEGVYKSNQQFMDLVMGYFKE